MDVPEFFHELVYIVVFATQVYGLVSLRKLFYNKRSKLEKELSISIEKKKIFARGKNIQKNTRLQKMIAIY